MEHFRNRNDKTYRRKLLDRLSILGKNGVIQTALKAAKPKIVDNVLYDRVASIDFKGIAATTLLDKGEIFHSSNRKTAHKFEELLANTSLINEHGIFLRIRLLLSYPYSDFAFTRIRAEHARNRVTIEDKNYFRGHDLLSHVDKKAFDRSSFVINQNASLNHLQYLINKYELNDDRVNSIEVRFTPIGFNLCFLLINNAAFFDTYTLAKEDDSSKRLYSASPLIMVVKDDDENLLDKDVYLGIENHFLYVWKLDKTLLSEDATNEDKIKCTGLDEVLPPSQISFDEKLEMIKNLYQEKGIPYPLKVEDEVLWKFKLRYLFNQSVQNITTQLLKETLFITCSWEGKISKIPNKYASKIEFWLRKDLERCMDIKLLKAKPGKELSNEIFNALHVSTMAVVILTKDIQSADGIWYSKPNVYHELGYFMNKFGVGRLLILVENDAHIPTNVKHLVTIKFSRENFGKKYFDVLTWLSGTDCIIPKKYIDSARINHQKRTVDPHTGNDSFLPTH